MFLLPQAAYDQLKAHGCSFEPSLPVEAERICAECTLIAWKGQQIFTVSLSGSAQLLVHLAPH
jgi:hypothetical protein